MIAKALTVAAFVAFVAVPSVSRSATCCVDGSCIYGSTLSTGNAPLTTLCGHTVSESGTGSCTVTMAQDETYTATTSCVSLSAKVNLHMNDHAITCTSDDCGVAVLVSATSNAGDIVGPGAFLGCWRIASYSQYSGTGSTITDINVDLRPVSVGACNSSGNVGLGEFKTITRALVGYANSRGIDGSATGTINNSIVHDCVVGIQTHVTPGTKINDSLVIGNGVNIKAIAASANLGPTLEGSTVRAPGTCDFVDYTGSCNNWGAVMTLNGTNFVDDTIILSGVQTVP